MDSTITDERSQQTGSVTDEVWHTVDRMIVDAWKIGGCQGTLDMLAMQKRFEAIAPMLRGVPDGWKLVPIEPTVGMLDAGYVAYSEAECRRGRAWYRAVLAASPSQEKDNG